MVSQGKRPKTIENNIGFIVKPAPGNRTTLLRQRIRGPDSTYSSETRIRTEEPLQPSFSGNEQKKPSDAGLRHLEYSCRSHIRMRQRAVLQEADPAHSRSAQFLRRCYQPQGCILQINNKNLIQYLTIISEDLHSIHFRKFQDLLLSS